MWAAIILVALLKDGDPCAGRGTVLLVQARQRVLSTCERGRRTGAYRVLDEIAAWVRERQDAAIVIEDEWAARQDRAARPRARS